MFMSEARRLCPSLIVVGYDFDKYQEVSDRVYRILLRYTSAVLPISCDEAYMDVTGKIHVLSKLYYICAT